jgi:hypothetical protein
LIETFEADVDHGFTQYVYNVAGAAPLVEWTAAYGNATAKPERPLGAPRFTQTKATVLFTQPPDSVSTKGGGATREVLSGLGDGYPGYVLSVLTDKAAQVEVLRGHVLWDEPHHRKTAEWLHHASDLPDLAELLRRRLALNPADVPALRLEQDRAEAKGDHEVCRRHRAMADAAQHDADLQYIGIRCRKGGQERDEAFIAMSEKHPENPWLAMATGYAYARRAEWDLALNKWKLAYEYPGMPEYVMLDVARVLRLGGDVTADRLEHLARSSPLVHQKLVIESGKDIASGPLLAYSALARGALSEALSAASSEPDVAARVVRLVASSTGATRDQIDQALALDEQKGVDIHTIWPAIALALRHERSADALIAQAKKLADPEELDAALKFANPRALLQDPAMADSTAAELRPTTRAHAYTMACVILGQDAPEAWRVAVRALLFADERPYIE